jgi:hypothetical protein
MNMKNRDTAFAGGLVEIMSETLPVTGDLLPFV